MKAAARRRAGRLLDGLAQQCTPSAFRAAAMCRSSALPRTRKGVADRFERESGAPRQFPAANGAHFRPQAARLGEPR
jgi:hypothetical protein